eukprot:gene7898-12366_t
MKSTKEKEEDDETLTSSSFVQNISQSQQEPQPQLTRTTIEELQNFIEKLEKKHQTEVENIEKEHKIKMDGVYKSLVSQIETNQKNEEIIKELTEQNKILQENIGSNQKSKMDTSNKLQQQLQNAHVSDDLFPFVQEIPLRNSVPYIKLPENRNLSTEQIEIPISQNFKFDVSKPSINTFRMSEENPRNNEKFKIPQTKSNIQKKSNKLFSHPKWKNYKFNSPNNQKSNSVNHRSSVETIPIASEEQVMESSTKEIDDPTRSQIRTSEIPVFEKDPELIEEQKPEDSIEIKELFSEMGEILKTQYALNHSENSEMNEEFFSEPKGN